MSKRSVALSVVLTLVTCGFYGLYWQAKVNDEVHALSRDPQTTTGWKSALFSFITCGIYYYYWLYKIGDELSRFRQKRDLPMDPVSTETYTIVTIITTIIAVIFSCLQFLVNLISSAAEEGQEITDDLIIGFIVVSLVFFGIFLLMHIVLAAVVLWVNYKRKDKSPQTLYVVIGFLRTLMFTTAFLQVSLNDLVDRQVLPEREG